MQVKNHSHLTVQSRVEVVKYLRTVLDAADASGIAIVETRLEERFCGGLEGLGQATHLRLEHSDGTCALLCYERFTGKLGELEGAFLLQASGFMDRFQDVHGRWEIVAGSGTGALTGIRGYAAFMARRDVQASSGWSAETALTYWFEK